MAGQGLQAFVTLTFLVAGPPLGSVLCCCRWALCKSRKSDSQQWGSCSFKDIQLSFFLPAASSRANPKKVSDWLTL